MAVTDLATVRIATSPADIARLTERMLRLHLAQMESIGSTRDEGVVAALRRIRSVVLRFSAGDPVGAADLWREDRFEKAVDPLRGEHILVQEGEAVISWLFSGADDRLDHALSAAMFIATWRA